MGQVLEFPGIYRGEPLKSAIQQHGTLSAFLALVCASNHELLGDCPSGSVVLYTDQNLAPGDICADYCLEPGRPLRGMGIVDPDTLLITPLLPEPVHHFLD